MGKEDWGGGAAESRSGGFTLNNGGTEEGWGLGWVGLVTT